MLQLLGALHVKQPTKLISRLSFQQIIQIKLLIRHFLLTLAETHTHKQQNTRVEKYSKHNSRRRNHNIHQNSQIMWCRSKVDEQTERLTRGRYFYRNGVLASEDWWEAWQPSLNRQLSVIKGKAGSPRRAWGEQVCEMWSFSLQCSDTVGWATGRASGL